MKRNLRSAIRGLLALGGACLLFTVLASAAPPDEAMDSYSPLVKKDFQGSWDDDSDDDSDGDRHWRRDVSFVVGSAYTTWDEPNDKWQFKRTYAVVKNWRGVRGHIFVDYHGEYFGDRFDMTYVIKADCLEVDKDERIAWIGGEIVYVTTTEGFPEVGWWIVNKVDDNDGGNPLNPDMHGAAWLVPETCEDRPEPFFYDRSERGKVIVR